MMDKARLGKTLLNLCKNELNRIAEIETVLERVLSEDDRRELVRYKDTVSL